MARNNHLSLVRGENEWPEEKQERKLPKWVVVLLAVGLVCLVGIGIYYNYNATQTFNGYETIYSTDWQNTGEYVQNGSQIIRYTGNGAEAVDTEGNLLWNITYEMKNPTIACCGDMAVIAERGGRQLLLSTGSGTVLRETMLYPVYSVAIAKQGVFAVMMNSDDRDYIHLYDKNMSLLYEIETVVAGDGFPQAMALSEDGTKLVTSYLAVAGDRLTSHVTFYNFSNVGENYIRNIVGQVQYDDSLVPRLAFLDNDTICAFTETGFEMFAMKEVPASKVKIVFEERIKSIAIGEILAFVLENAAGNEKNHIVAYDMQGNKCMDVTNSYSYEYVRAGEQEVLLHSGLSVLALRLNGSKKFQYEFEANIEAMFPIEKNKYFLIYQGAVHTIKLTEEKEES